MSRTSSYSKLILLSFGVILLNVIFIAVQYAQLPDILPTRYFLEGHGSGSMHRALLWLYPTISAIAIVLLTMVAFCVRNKKRVNLIQLICGLIALALSLLALCESCIILTFGQQIMLMIAKPVILVMIIAEIIFLVLKSR